MYDMLSMRKKRKDFFGHYVFLTYSPGKGYYTSRRTSGVWANFNRTLAQLSSNQSKTPTLMVKFLLRMDEVHRILNGSDNNPFIIRLLRRTWQHPN